MHLSSNQAFNSSRVLNRSRGVKKRSRTSPTWFSTWPFSQPDDRAGNRIDEIVAAHLQEASIVETRFADEDRLHRRLHVVVNAAPTGAFEQGERPVVGIEHHLLRLAWITPHKQHPAMAEPDMGGLHDHRHAIEQNHLVAPVELIGFSRCKAQRDIGCSRRLPALLAGRRSPGLGGQYCRPNDRVIPNNCPAFTGGAFYCAEFAGTFATVCHCFNDVP
jgi:hypothetical protein